MQRYFANIDKDFNVCFSKEDEHHILHVMRMKVADEIEVVDNQKVYLCRIDKTNPLEVSVIHEISNDVRVSNRYWTTLFYLLFKDRYYRSV